MEVLQSQCPWEQASNDDKLLVEKYPSFLIHQQENSATWSIFSSRRPWDWSPGAHDGPLIIIARSYGSLPFSSNYSTFPPVFPGTAFQITNLHLNFCPWICFWGHPSGCKRHKGELTALNGPWNCKRQAWRPANTCNCSILVWWLKPSDWFLLPYCWPLHKICERWVILIVCFLCSS